MYIGVNHPLKLLNELSSEIRPLRLIIRRINPNEMKRFIVYGNIQHAKLSAGNARTRAHTAFRDLLTTLETPLVRPSKHAE